MDMVTFFSLLGGLGLFLLGMKDMSEGLEKERNLRILHEKSIYRNGGRYFIYSGSSVIKRYDGYGSQLCKFRSYDSFAGDWSNLRSQYRYYSNRSVDRI